MTAALRLRSRALTVLLGHPVDRHGVLAALDESTGRRDGRDAVAVQRLVLRPEQTAAERVERLERAAGCALLLVDGVTAGLDAAGRREVLDALRALTGSGTAVLADDADPLALLAVADAALRVDPDGSLVADPL